MISKEKQAQYSFERDKTLTMNQLTTMMQELTMYPAPNAYMYQYRKNLLKLLEMYNNMCRSYAGFEEIKIKK